MISASFEYQHINQLHIELTNRCNAACPMCMRFHQSSPLIRPDLVLGEITITQFKKWFPPEFIKKIDLVLFCGVHGDPCIARDTLEITEYILSCRIDTRIMFNTNGGMRNPAWWSELGSLLKNNIDNIVTFSIDGLEDTNHLYRRNVKWQKLMSNVTAYIAAGGRAHWDYLIFKHNEHQIEDALNLAKELNFKKFIPKKALGVDDGVNLSPMGVIDKEGQLHYTIEAPINPKNRNLENPKSIGGVSMNLFTVDQYNKMKTDNSIQIQHAWSSSRIYDVLDSSKYKSEDSCKIKCKSLKEDNIELFIDNYGNVLPCCYVGTHINGNYADDKTLQLHHEIKKYGIDKFNLNNHTLYEIIKQRHIDKVFTDSWDKQSIKTGKLLMCADTCGKVSSIDRIMTHEMKTELK